MSTLQPRVTALASTFAAGTAVAGAALFGGVPMVPLPTPGPLGVQRDFSLTSADEALAAAFTGTTTTGTGQTAETLAASLKFLLDNMLGIGNKTFPDLVGDKTTLESLLAGSHLSVSSPMSDVFNSLGLQNFTMGQVMGDLGLPTSSTIDDVMTKLGFQDMKLDQLMGAFGLSDSTTLVTVMDDLGMGKDTLGQMMGMVGITPTTNMDNIMTGLGLGQLEGLLPLLGMTASGTVLSTLSTAFGDPNLAGLTLDQLMNAAPATGAVQGDGFLSTVGSMTLGTLLGFNSTTTVGGVLDGMQLAPGTVVDGTALTSATSLGALNLTDLLDLVKITPSMTLATVLGDLPLGYGDQAGGTTAATDLGNTTLGNLLASMLISSDVSSGSTVAAGVGGVTDASTLADFLTGIGLGNMDLDTFLGLG